MGALTCKDCRHWQPLLPENERAYRTFLAGYGRRVKHPSGYCRHFQLHPGETTRSAETRAHQPACRNFAARPTPPAEPLPESAHRTRTPGPLSGAAMASPGKARSVTCRLGFAIRTSARLGSASDPRTKRESI